MLVQVKPQPGIGATGGPYLEQKFHCTFKNKDPVMLQTSMAGSPREHGCSCSVWVGAMAPLLPPSLNTMLAIASLAFSSERVQLSNAVVLAAV